MSTINLDTKRCCRCADTWISASSEPLCPNCRHSDLLQKCSDTALAGIDRYIYDRRLVPGLMAVREEFGIGVDESIEWISWRHQQLRRLNPEKFTIGSNESRDIFYS